MFTRSLLPAVLLGVSALPTFADAPRVVTDIAPVQGLVARVMAGVGEPDVLVPPGASPHGYSLRPSDARALSSSDAVFWIGDELEPWLADSLSELAAEATIVSLLDAPGTTRLDFREGVVFAQSDHDHDHDHGHDHEDDHDHEEGHDHDHADAHHDEDEHAHEDHGHDHDDHDHGDHGHDHSGHSHEGVDPHAWLSPQNGKQWLALIAEELAKIDPTNAEIYQSNALAGQVEIDELVQSLGAELEQTDGQFVVFHDAYQYFETSFGLKSLGAISLGDASDPSVARVAEIRDAILAADVSCVFSEPQFNPGLVRTVTEGAEVASVVIDPLGTKIEAGASFYTDLLADTGARFVECLSS